MSITFRPATIDNAALLFAWQQHPETRLYCGVSKSPEWDEHLGWIDRILADMGRELMIAYSGGHPIGMLRLDTNFDDVEISILVAPGLRGKGYATAMLEQLKETRPENCFSARVMEGNAASHKLFQKSGFRKLYDGFYIWNGPKSYARAC